MVIPMTFQMGYGKEADIEMMRGLATETHQYWEAKLQAPHNRLNYGFNITGLDGEELFFGDQGFEPLIDETAGSDGLMGSNAYFKMPYFQEIDRFKAPEWVKETIWYQIFPERFANGDPSNDNEGTLPWDPEAHPTREAFYGGDLRGVIDHLDHLVDLGINGIYFNPIFEAPTNHKYDTRNYLEIDPHFGTKADFKELVDKAHARGIKVMLDAVFNHIGMKAQNGWMYWKMAKILNMRIGSTFILGQSQRHQKASMTIILTMKPLPSRATCRNSTRPTLKFKITY